MESSGSECSIGTSSHVAASDAALEDMLNISPERLSVDTGYRVPGCSQYFDDTPRPDQPETLASVPPGPALNTVRVEVSDSEEKSSVASSNDSKPATPALLAHQPSDLEMPRTFSTLNNLLEANKTWAARMHQKKPDFFARLAGQQAPQLLWIGCSDSR